MGVMKRKSTIRKASLDYHKVSHLYEAQDATGVPDMVLLEDYTSEDAFIDNLKIRYSQDIIYTYIGSVLIAINPYKNIPIYTPEFINKYRGVNLFEMPPHIFALSDLAYRAMMGSQSNQSMLISGESGAGKTESMKKVILYIAAASHHSPEVERVREKLQKSVPVLEAMGNAKTNRNDNSSRFGKYMDIQFNFMGSIVGAKVTSYLLEKSRVVYQNKGERNFHIFYQVFKMKEISDALYLQPDPASYNYIMQKDSMTVATLDDFKELKLVLEGLRICGVSEEEEKAFFSIIGSVLHFGQINFEEKAGKLEMKNEDHLKFACELIQCPSNLMNKALLHRKIASGKDIAIANLSKSEAYYARDALSKTIYERCFIWLVERMNECQKCQLEDGVKCRLGLLDIFGFEIFILNSFEQLCINFCNEKLHQLFIEKTLKEEQEDYLREGIEWIPIEYDDNSPICQLIQGAPNGILGLLDEECLMPGNRTDITFHAKLEDKLKDNPAFATRTTGGLDKELRKGLKPEEFKIKHYAGPVVYSVAGFLDKNKDLLFRDVKEILCDSKHLILIKTFHKDELDDKKRPLSVGTQFKNSLEKLLTTLEKEELHYIRCIKPNMEKLADTMDDTTIRHQVRYMGLVENVRVCRAGFAYKRPYEYFIKRYYCICPSTWPKYYQFSSVEAVKEILEHYKYTLNIDYKFGKTKIFVKSAKTISQMETKYSNRKIELVTMIQAIWRCYNVKKMWEDLRFSMVFVQKWIRTFLAKQKFLIRKKAVITLQRFARACIDLEKGKTETEPYKDVRASLIL
ncbi:unconventional myosin-Ic-like [Gordionus sp. m RMFG-2023]|uniref:unconventional myosin-Ic-like n=1 Tax=Gordionus sp. m RMFG-2023 TaxID=3053472 RepID=UPI0031FBC6C5